MAIVTTYICDVSGKSGSNKEDFIQVEIISTVYKANNYSQGGYGSDRTTSATKLVSREVALKLNLVPAKTIEEAQPEVTFESKLTTLLKDYISDLVVDEVSDQMNHRN